MVSGHDGPATMTLMKTNLLVLCAAVALAAPTIISAQDGPPPAERPAGQQLREELRNLPPEERQARMRELREQYGGPGRPQPGMMAGRMGGGAAGGLERVGAVLTPEQRESIRGLLAENREKAAGIETKLRDARAAVLETALEKNFNEDALRQKLEAVSKLEVELTLLRAKAFAQIEPPLSAEQIERIKNPPPMRPAARERFGPGGPDGGPEGMPPRGPARGPRPPGGEPRDENDLPPPARP
jgi:Spy/CpxP family protein refolding chaperone